MHIEKTIYLVRHAQSIANVTPVFQSLNSPLSELGKAQATSLAERISHISFETLISSPVERAKQTAVIIESYTKQKIEFSDLFVERIKPTSISGKSYEDKQASLTNKKWKKSLCTLNMRIEDGENFADILSRADKALNFLKNRTEKTLVVVTHGYFLRKMIARVLLNDTFSVESFKNFEKSIRHANTGITVLRYITNSDGSSGWQLWIYNDHAHLINT